MSEAQEADGLIQLEVLTPSREVTRLSVPMATLPGVEGYFGVLPGHMPMITRLKAGVISFEEGGMPRRMAVSSAVVEVVPERVIVLARSAELADDIDAERARRALSDAEAKLAGLAEGDDGRAEAEDEAERAKARVEALEEGE